MKYDRHDSEVALMNRQNNDGMTPLMLAAAFGHDAVAETLIDDGAAAMHASSTESQQELRRLFSLLDESNGGRSEHVECSEFVAATLPKYHYLNETHLNEAFGHWDVDRSGWVTQQNLKDALGAQFDLLVQGDAGEMHAQTREFFGPRGPESGDEMGITFDRFVKVLGVGHPGGRRVGNSPHRIHARMYTHAPTHAPARGRTHACTIIAV